MPMENPYPYLSSASLGTRGLIGQKRPLKPKDVWTIRVRLQQEGSKRDLAMFNLAERYRRLAVQPRWQKGLVPVSEPFPEAAAPLDRPIRAHHSSVG
jgi:hypothetical protein